MGINLSLYREEDGQWVEHPTWDWIRYAGDREVCPIIRDLGSETTTREDEWDELIRPKDVEAFRAAMKAATGYNPRRWDELADAFNEGWWLYVSW